MKEKNINLKNKTITLMQKIKGKVILFLENLKNRITPSVVNLKDRITSFIIANKKISIIIGIILIAIIAIIIFVCNRKTKIGNTNTNLNNLGFATQNNGWVYYLGFDEGQSDGIYKLKGNKNKKIIDDYALYLNESDKNIYYLDSEENIVKIKTNGEDKETVIEDVDIEKFIIVDDWIYYFDEAKLCKIRTNGKEKQIILEKSIENYEFNKDCIYYSYKDNGKYIIAKIKTNGEDNIKISENTGATFFIKGNYIYYIYENYYEENNEYKNELWKTKINGKNKEKIADLSEKMYINSVNFNGNEIYYLKKDEETKLAIYKINLKEGKETKVVDVNGYVTYLNIIDNWIYYPDVDENGNDAMFRIKTNGTEKQNLSL